MKRLKSLYRVDTVPIWLKPLFWVYGYGGGFLLILYVLFVRLTSRVKVLGSLPPGPVIRCFWHEMSWAFFNTVPSSPRGVMLVHPDWYMMPAILMVRFVVGRIVLGSSGNDGKKAAQEIVPLLREGYHTAITPDGPEGPAHTLRKGALHFSAQSGVPIVPVRYRCRFFVRLFGWDRQWIPLPFNRFEVEYRPAIHVNSTNLDQAAEALKAELGT